MEIEKKLGYLKRGKKVISDDEIVSIKIIKNAKEIAESKKKEAMHLHSFFVLYRLLTLKV